MTVPPEASLDPKPGATLERDLATDEHHSYSIRLAAGDYLELSVESSRIDVALVLSPPSDANGIEASYRQEGIKCVSFLVATGGEHRVEVRALEKHQVSGRYRLRIDKLRESVATDRDRVEAAAWFNEAEALRGRWTAESNREARQAYEAALQHGEAADDRVAQARALRRLGDVLLSLGEPSQALEQYRRAKDRAVEAKDLGEEVGALNGLSRAELVLGDNAAALRHGARALELSRESEDPAEEADALNNLGDVHALQGRTRESLDVYADALSRAEAGGDRRQRARSLLNLGYSRSDLSEVERALRAYEGARSLYVELADHHGQAVTLNALGHLHSKMGERQKALGQYLRAREFFEAMGEPLGGGITANGLGLVYLELGEPEVALEYYRQQLRLHRAAEFPQGEGGALAQIGRCHYLMGHPQKALEHLKEALNILESIEDQKVATYARGLLGLAYEAVGDAGNALRAHERSLELSRAIGDRREASYALNRIARLLHEEGRTEEALDHLDRARALSHESRDRVGEALSLYNTAVIEDGRGRLRVALDRVRESLELSESLRTDVASLDLRSSYFASVRERREREIGLLMRLHDRLPADGYDRLAFVASEKARARSLLDGLAEARAGIREGVEPALLEREASFRRALNAKAERLVRLDHEDATDREALELELDELTNALRELEAEVRAASPRFAALMQPRPLRLEEVQRQVVDPRSVLLQYFVGERQSFLWVVTRDSLESHLLPGREVIAGLVHELRASLLPTVQPGGGATRHDSSMTALPAAAALSRILLGPVDGRFEGKRLLVALDGVLQLVPFAALPRRRSGEPRERGGWLLAEHEIVYLPSASTVALVRGEWEQARQWPKSVAVFADPVFEADDPRIGRRDRPLPAHGQQSPVRKGPLPRALRASDGSEQDPGIVRLLETRHEARAIAALLPDAKLALGFEASRETATSPELAEYRIVHFATHGIVNNDHPELSGVVLSLFNAEGTPQDGFLRLHDIYNLHLPVDLVVLSACSTALGRAVTGEGLVGLVRGFMYAGSRRVVASLWDVDDEATGELMKLFYKRMFQDGLAPPAALRAAQLEMSKQRRWSHPRNWAAFVLQGEWKADDVGRPSPHAQ